MKNDLEQQNKTKNRNIALGVTAIFATQFVSFLFINARNIAQPQIIAELDGMALFSWLIALPALGGAASTLLFGKLSDIYGRRAMLLLSIAIFLFGLGISSKITSMAWLVASATFMSVGHFPIIPLCFSTISDLFPPSERVKWTGLLSLPGGIAALIGPVLGGVMAESAWGWRGLYWGTIPLMLAAATLVVFALPENARKVKPKVDVPGTIAMLAATSTLTIGVSWLGTPHRFGMALIILVVSVVAWVAFIGIEKRTQEPILDPHVFLNRPFMTAAGAAMLSFFGTLGMIAYSPIFVQSVMKISPTISGSMLTPYSIFVAFMGIPTGLFLARTRRYKGMYNISYAVVTLSMFAIWRFTSNTPIWVYVLVTAVAGLGFGVIPTITTLVAQFAVPQRLLGAAIGAIFFFQMVGITIAPSILSLAQKQAADLEGGLKLVFLASAIALLLAFALITTIPQISMGTESSER